MSTPEEELLLLCARAHLDGPAAERAHALLEEDVDWNRLVALAERHLVVARLYKHLNDLAFDRVPLIVMDDLRCNFEKNVLRNLGLIGELRRLIRLFKDNGILLIPLRGPVFSQLIYQDVGIRRSEDLDILILKEDFARVQVLLRSAEYEPRIRCNSVQERLLLKCGFERQFESAAFGEAEVDLHWDIMSAAYLRVSIVPDLVNNSSDICLLGENVCILSAEDLLFVSCIHAASHLWLSLDVISDVAEIIYRYPRLNWDLLWEQVQKTKGQRALFVSLLLVCDLFNIPVPEEVLAAAKRDAGARKLAEHARDALFKEPKRRSKFDSVFDRLATKESLRDRVHILFFYVFVPTANDFRLMSLPASLTPFYYFYHPLRVTVEFVVSLLQPRL